MGPGQPLRGFRDDTLVELAPGTGRAIFDAMSSLRMPQGHRSPFQSGASVLDVEIQQERSAALGAQ